MKKKATLGIITAIILTMILGGNAILANSQGLAENVAEDVGDSARSIGNGIVNGAVEGAGMVRSASNTVVNGVDQGIEATKDIAPVGEEAKNQTQTMTTEGNLADTRDNLSSRTFLGINFSIWMWIILIIVIIVIIVLICRYMKQHDDEEDNHRD